MKMQMLALITGTMLFCMSNTGCSKSTGHPDKGEEGGSIKSGRLYYSAADQLIEYDFSTKKQTTIYSDGDHYSVSPEAKRFLWYKNDFSGGLTHVQIHDLSKPASFSNFTVAAILEATPKFISEKSNLYLALSRAADGAVKRTDLIIFNNEDGKIIGRIPHVKAFCLLSAGQDLAISAEALDPQGNPVGFALAVIKNFQSEQNQENFTIHAYQDYSTLPEDLTPAPQSHQIAFVHQDHLYRVDVQKGATPRQLTSSRFREADPGWSPDGKYIAFTANTPDASLDCGEVRVIPSNAQNIIDIPEDKPDNEPADPLQPLDIQGKSINACGSEGYLWL